ncbi:MAG: preprotein translocase subunit SecE [Planctomycetota bacterium]
MSTPDNNNPSPLPVTGGGPAASAPAPPPASQPTSAPAAPAPAPKPSGASLQEKRLFNFYRPDEGHRARALIGIAIAILGLYGSHSLWDWLPKGPEDFWGKKIFDLGSDEFALNPAVALALALSVGVLAAVLKLVNYPRFVDFLIDTESELKKVSWASRRQVMSESIVVLATVVIVGLFVFTVDQLLILIRTGIQWNEIWNKLLG